MSREIHIDQFIKEKIELLNFPYEESYWLDAEKLIAAAEQEKRRRFLFWIFLITTISVLAVFYAVLSSPNKTSFYKFQMNRPSFVTSSASISEDTLTTQKEFVKIVTKESKNRETNIERHRVKHISVKKRFGFFSKRKEKTVSDSISIRPYKLEEEQLKSISAEALDSLEKLYSDRIESPNEYNLWLTEEENSKKYKKHNSFIGFSAGATYNSKLDPAYFASIHIQKILSKKWSTRISTQLAATKFPFLIYKYTKIDYSFGEVVTVNEIKSNTVYSLQIPVSLHFRFYKFNSAFVGLGYAHYLAQKNNISTVQNSQTSTRSEYGVSRDIRKDNVFVSLGFETMVWRKYQLGLSAQIPLLNPIVNTQKSNGGTIINYPEMKVYLLYNLIKIK